MKDKQEYEAFRNRINLVEHASTQLELVTEFLHLAQPLLAA